MNFSKEVIERSKSMPVLVDFWAPWCSPCRFLGPILEDLASEQKERWELVKVNTEEHPEIAMNYGIMSIPNVKLFYEGEIIDEFTGALPKFAIQQWLDKNIPDKSDIELEKILSQAGEIPDMEMVGSLKKHLKTYPEDDKARVQISKHLAFNNPEDAEKYLPKLQMNHELYDEAEDIRILLEFQNQEYLQNTKVGSAMFAAKEAFIDGQFEQTLKHIIEANVIDKKYLDDLPRRLAIALFRIFGNQNELTRKYRKQFDMALY